MEQNDQYTNNTIGTVVHNVGRLKHNFNNIQKMFWTCLGMYYIVLQINLKIESYVRIKN